MSDNRTCIRCKETKEESQFRSDKLPSGTLSFRKMCRACTCKQQKVCRMNNWLKHLESSAKSYRRRKAEHLRVHKVWVEKNRELKRAIRNECSLRMRKGKGTTLVSDSGVGYARRKTISRDRSYVEESME